MLNWSSTCTLDSTLAPGVRFHFKKFSKGRRAELELSLASYRAEMREKMLEYADAIETPEDEPHVKAAKQTRRTALMVWSNSAVERHIKPQTLRTYLKGIDGIEIDGGVPTVEQFIDDGPEALADEAFEFITEHGGMTDAQAKNSPAPSISPEAEGGRSTNTTAASAETTATTPSETAGCSPEF